jgi:hypothetical protein
MSTLLIVRDIYTKAFETLKNYQEYFFKLITGFVVTILAIGIFAVIYRLSTGFFGI